MGPTRRRFLTTIATAGGLTALNLGGETSTALGNKTDQPTGQKTQSIPTSFSKFWAQAVDFEERVVYYPDKRPGYAAWVAPWKGPNGALFLSFIEKRQLPNPNHRPIPLDFWEAMGLPIKYQASFCTDPNILTESVILQSLDQGKTWKEVGRSATSCLHHFGYLSLADGSMLRGNHNAYLAYYPKETPICSIQKSSDLGNSWTNFAVVGKDFFFYPYRLISLHDGTLFFLGGYREAFGPGRRVPRRTETRGNVRREHQAAFYYSFDQGAKWTGPIPVFPGVYASEPDVVELSSEELLLVNSKIAGGDTTRQKIRRQGNNFVPQPVFDIVKGPVPETIVQTKSGLLVGTSRGGVYACSKDEGNNWYPIDGLPRSLYQPRIVELNDGRLCNFFHLGGDDVFGEKDQHIGNHVFRLQEELPVETTLELMREKNRERSQYINVFRAVLRKGDRPVPNQDIRFTVRSSSRGRKSYHSQVFVRSTDVNGQARVELPEFDRCIDIHRDYSVKAEFEPVSPNEALVPAQSTEYACYRMTSSAGKKHTYEFYVAKHQLFVSKERLSEFPEIHQLVEKFGLQPDFSKTELREGLKIIPTRLELFIEGLIHHNVLVAKRSNSYRWNEVELTAVMPIVVEDDFLVGD